MLDILQVPHSLGHLELEILIQPEVPPVSVRANTPDATQTLAERSDLRIFELIDLDTHRVIGAIPQVSDLDGLARLQVTG